MSNETNIHRNARNIQKHTNLTYQQARQLLIDAGGRQNLNTPDAIVAFVETAQAANTTPGVGDFGDFGDYISLEDCINDGIHLDDCDDDGYCNHCGHQDNPDDDLDTEDIERGERNDLCDDCKPAEHPTCSLTVGCACCDTTINALADEPHHSTPYPATISAAAAKAALVSFGWTPDSDRLDALELVFERLCELARHSDYALDEHDYNRLDTIANTIVDNATANWDTVA